MNKLLRIENEVKEIIERQNLAVSSDFVMQYWNAKQWRTKKGTRVQSIGIAVHVCNSIYLTRLRKSDCLQSSIF